MIVDLRSLFEGFNALCSLRITSPCRLKSVIASEKLLPDEEGQSSSLIFYVSAEKQIVESREPSLTRISEHKRIG